MNKLIFIILLFLVPSLSYADVHDVPSSTDVHTNSTGLTPDSNKSDSPATLISRAVNELSKAVSLTISGTSKSNKISELQDKQRLLFVAIHDLSMSINDTNAELKEIQTNVISLIIICSMIFAMVVVLVLRRRGDSPCKNSKSDSLPYKEDTPSNSMDSKND